MDIGNLLEVNDLRKLKICVRYVGADKVPVMVVDNFLRFPFAVRDFALSLSYQAPLRGDLWPGVQAAASLNRDQIQSFVIEHYLKGVLGFNCDGWQFPPVRAGSRADHWSAWFLLTRFGVITMPFKQATWANNPHVDYFGFIASVLYLSLPEHSKGGTVFVKHRATGIESLPPTVSQLPEPVCEMLRNTQSFKVIQKTILAPSGRSDGPELQKGQVITPSDFDKVWRYLMTGNAQTEGYLTESNAVWELTDQVDMAFNRLVLYPTWNLHSVSWNPSWFGHEISKQRLTMMNWLALPAENKC